MRWVHKGDKSNAMGIQGRQLLRLKCINIPAPLNDPSRLTTTDITNVLDEVLKSERKRS